MKSHTSEMCSDNRIGSNSTNKQEGKDKEDEAPLQSGQLLPFLQAHRKEATWLTGLITLIEYILFTHAARKTRTPNVELL